VIVEAMGTPLVEVKEDVLSKAKNGSPERLRLWVRPPFMKTA